jgi:hypothetical protein
LHFVALFVCLLDIPFVSTEPQMLFTVRLEGVDPSILAQSSPATLSPVAAQIMRAGLWWTHVTDPSRIDIVSVSTVGNLVSVTCIIGGQSRQQVVEMMRLLDISVLSNNFLTFLQNKMQVNHLYLQEYRLTSARRECMPSPYFCFLPTFPLNLSQSLSIFPPISTISFGLSPTETGIMLNVPTEAAALPTGHCERVVIDTGGCDEPFKLSAPYDSFRDLPAP